MGIFDGCLLALDVDGTLIVGDYLPPENVKAMDYFKSEGGTLCLATGRTSAALTPIIEMYGGFGPSVVSNGSMIYDIENDKVLFEKTLGESDKALTLTLLKKYPGFGVELHCGKRVYVISRTAETDDHERYEKIPTDFVDREKIFDLSLQKALFLFSSPEERKTVKEYALSLNPTCDFTDSAATIDGKKRYYLEQLPHGMSKAATLKLLANMLKTEKEKVFAIGDYYNDLEMIKYAYISACPNTSPEEIKKEADFVVTDPTKGAVADFIDILKGEILNGHNFEKRT